MLIRRRTSLLGLFFLVVILISGLLPAGRSQAGITTQRTVILSSGVPSANTSHLFKFTLPSTTDTGSIVFEYCSNSPLIYFPCTPPPGLDTSAASLDSQTGNTGFSIDNADSTSNVIVLSRPVSPANTSPSTYLFNNIINPSTPGQSVFVRIWTHASTDGSGPKLDGGAAAFAVQSIFNIGAFVPPFLKLCVGLIVAPDCSSMSGDSIDFGILSPNHVSFGQSQFATATNDPNGYVVFALGTTMTSGINTISALSSPSASFPGTGQFGFNLRANLIPTVGQDPVGLGTGLPTANYNIPDRYTFNDGDSITSSTLPSDYNRMTSSYIVNIPSKQAPGIYATTITYVATVEF